MNSLAIALLSATLCAFVAGQNLVLLGGNLRGDNIQLWNKMVDLAGGKGVAKIGVISASNVSPVEANRVVDMFVKVYGAKSAVSIPITVWRANRLSVTNQIREQTGIFIVEDSDLVRSFSVWNWLGSFVRTNNTVVTTPSDLVAYESPSRNRQNLIDVLRPFGADTMALTAIKSVLSNGGMVAGNAAIMGKSAVILGGDAISALVTGTRFRTILQVPFYYNRGGGLALLNADYVLESQLSDKGREMRLIRTLLESGVSKGLGVDQNAALVVSNPLTKPIGKVVTALYASNGVFFTDVSTVSSSSGRNAYYEKVPFSFYTVDDEVDLTTGNVVYAPWKVAIAGEEYFANAIPSDDILSRSAPNRWRETSRRLIDCQELTVTSYSPASLIPRVPRVQVIFDRTSAVGFGADIPGDPNKNYVPSFRNMYATVKVQGFV